MTYTSLWEESQARTPDSLYGDLYAQRVHPDLLNQVYMSDTLVRALWLYVMTEASNA